MRTKERFWGYLLWGAIALGAWNLFNKSHHPTLPLPMTNQPNQLVVGLQSGYPPFEFVNSAGEIVGFDVDLSEKIAKKMSKTLKIRDMDFDALILSLKQGKIDLIVSGMNITPSRQKEITLIPYYGDNATELALIFWDTPSFSLEEISEGHLGAISVEAGTLAENYVAQYYPDIPLRTFQGALAPLMDVKYKKSIATAVESDVADYLIARYKETKKQPVAVEDALLGFGIGIRKDNKLLAAAIKEIIDSFQANGEIEELEALWFKNNDE